MTTIFTKQDIEAAAKAMKEALRVAWDGKPLLGNDRSGDWYADGGSINLTDLFQTGVSAAEASMKARGALREGCGWLWANETGWQAHTEKPDPEMDEFPALIIRLDKEGDT